MQSTLFAEIEQVRCSTASGSCLRCRKQRDENGDYIGGVTAVDNTVYYYFSRARQYRVLEVGVHERGYEQYVARNQATVALFWHA